MYVSQNYNPNIKGEGYAYFGAGVGQLRENSGARVFNIVDRLCKIDGNGYISSTEAGVLFNDPCFKKSFTEFIRTKLPVGVDMGKNIKLWNNQHNPYEEISSAKNTYGIGGEKSGVCKRLFIR